MAALLSALWAPSSHAQAAGSAQGGASEAVPSAPQPSTAPVAAEPQRVFPRASEDASDEPAPAVGSPARASGSLPPPPPPPPGLVPARPLALTPAEPRYDFDPTPSLLPVPDHPADTFTPKRTWYGWQTLAIDGASALIVITNLQDRRSQGYAWLGLAGYVLGPPIVHAAHDNWLSFAGSLGSRVLLPLAGGLIGIGANQCHGGSQDYCDVSGIATGILVGYAAAVTIDAVALAWTPKRKPDALAGNARTLRVGPLIGHDRQGLSVSGTF